MIAAFFAFWKLGAPLPARQHIRFMAFVDSFAAMLALVPDRDDFAAFVAIKFNTEALTLGAPIKRLHFVAKRTRDIITPLIACKVMLFNFGNAFDGRC